MEEERNIKLPYYGIPKLIPYIEKYRSKVILMIFMGALSSLIDSVYPLFYKNVLNVTVARKDLSTLPFMVVLYLLILLFQVWNNYYTCFICSKMELWVDRDLRNACFGHLQTLSFSFFNQNNVGYIHARVMSDTGKIGELVSWRLMDIIWNGSYIISVIVVMFITNAYLGLLITALVPVAVVVILIFQKKLVGLNRKVRELNSRIVGDFNEGITGVKALKTLVAEDKMSSSFREDTESYKKTSINTAHVAALFSSTITMISAVALSFILWQGGRLTLSNVIKIGTLSVFISYAMGIMEPIQSIINTISGLIQIQVNIERYTNLMNTESDVADREDVIEKYGDSFEPKKENWEEIIGDVEFKDVSFKYPDGDEMVLENFNLKVKAGQNVAIVGETGAGKSTLVNLVCRFFEPTEGKVLIDGRDAKDRSLLWLHSNIGYVLQSPHLFSGTIRENLLYAKPDATDEEIYRALDIVSATDLINKNKEGLSLDVGEGGNVLSTGERQLISFARAILSDPKILVLDEATSSIDTVTEKMIQSAIKAVIKGRTTFVIAHRLSTVVDADVILAVKDGKIIEKGNHEELMKRRGYYFNLFTSQLYEDGEV